MIDLFQKWDINGDGEVTRAEFSRAIPELGLWATPTEVDELFGSFDLDGNGTITFRELNRQLRRTRATDAESRARLNPTRTSDAVDVVDLRSLRKEVYKSVRTAAVNSLISQQMDEDGGLGVLSGYQASMAAMSLGATAAPGPDAY